MAQKAGLTQSAVSKIVQRLEAELLTEPMLQTQAGRDLVALPFETALLESGIGLFYRRKTYLSPAVQKFRAALHAALSVE